jgi:hypothetical protein
VTGTPPTTARDPSRFRHLADVVRAVDARDAALGGGHLRVPVHPRKRDEGRRPVQVGALVVRPTWGRGPAPWPAELESGTL